MSLFGKKKKTVVVGKLQDETMKAATDNLLKAQSKILAEVRKCNLWKLQPFRHFQNSVLTRLSIT